MSHRKPIVAIIGSKGYATNYGGIEQLVDAISPYLMDDFSLIIYGSKKYCSEQSLSPNRDFQCVNFMVPGGSLIGNWLVALMATVHGLFAGAKLFYYHACGPVFFAFIPRLLGIKVVWHFHGLDYLRPLVKLRILKNQLTTTQKVKQIFRFLVLRAGAFIGSLAANRIFLFEPFMNRHPFNRVRMRSKLCAITNFPATFGSQPRLPPLIAQWRKKYLLVVSRLVAEKGIDELIRVFSIIQTKHCEKIALFIIGEGDMKPALEQQAEGIPQIYFLGEIPHDELSVYYQNALLFCLFSAIEGQPLALLEALSQGCAVFARKTLPLGNLESNVFTFDSPDEAEIAEQMSRLLKEKETLEKVAKSGQEFVLTHYRKEKTIHTIREQFRALLVVSPTGDVPLDAE